MKLILDNFTPPNRQSSYVGHKIKCLCCKKEFIGKKNRKYCSLKCAWKSKDRVKNCPFAYTKEQREIIKQAYLSKPKKGFLMALSKIIKASKPNISRYARLHGWTNKHRKVTDGMKKELSILHKKYFLEHPDILKKLSIGHKKYFIKHPEARKKISENTKKWIKENGHPKGFAGHLHSQKVREASSKRSLKFWANLTKEGAKKMKAKAYQTAIRNGSYLKRGGYSDCRGGKRKDLNNTYFRSAWEANYARYLNLVKEKWQYEPRMFLYKDIIHGTRSYAPDFYLPKQDRWIEVKGYFRPKAVTAIKRFKKYYPNEFNKLTLVVWRYGDNSHIVGLELGIENIDFYKEIQDKVAGLIKYWEYK